MVEKRIIPAGPLNRSYRDTITKLIDMAEEEIVLIV